MSACRNVSRLPRGCPARAGGRGAISAPPLSPDPGQVESVHHWLLKRGAADGDLSPFALSLCCQGSKALRAQPRPFSVPVVAHATCRGTAGVLLPPSKGRSAGPQWSDGARWPSSSCWFSPQVLCPCGKYAVQGMVPTVPAVKWVDGLLQGCFINHPLGHLC